MSITKEPESIRQWLGKENLNDIGRWQEALREQPKGAKWIYNSGWQIYGIGDHPNTMIAPELIPLYLTWETLDDITDVGKNWRKALKKAIFQIPDSLAEWLGEEKVKELGPWAAKLREQPGLGAAWIWYYGEWRLQVLDWRTVTRSCVHPNHLISAVQGGRIGVDGCMARLEVELLLPEVFTGVPERRLQRLNRPKMEVGSAQPRGYWDPEGGV